MVSLAKLLNAQIKADVLAAQKTGELAKIAALNSPAATTPATTTTTKTVATTTPATQTVTPTAVSTPVAAPTVTVAPVTQPAAPTVSYDDMIKAAYGSIGRTGMGTAANQIDTEGYNYWLNALNTGAITPTQFNAKFNEAVTVANSAPKPPATVTDYQGNSFDSNVILSLAKQLAPTMDATKLAGGVYGTKGESIGFNYDEATKLLGHAPTAAEQVVLDMARQLNQKDITDLNQLPASDTSTRFGSTFTGGGGTIYEIQKDPTTGAITTSTWGKNTSDKGNIVAALSIGAGLLGIPSDVGAAILGTGSNTIAAGALGGGLFGAGTAALTDTDILKGALLGAAGGAAGNYIKGGYGADSTVAADTAGGLDPRYGGSNPLYGTKYDASMFNMLDSPEAQQALSDYINGTTTPTLTTTPTDTITTTPADTVNITGSPSSVTVPLTNVLSQIPTIAINANKTTQQVSPDTLSTVTSLLSGTPNTVTPEVKITATNPNKQDIPVVPQVPTNVPVTPVIPTVPITPTTPPTTPPKDPTIPPYLLPLLTGLFTTAAVNPVRTTPTVTTSIPTQGVPLNSDDYFKAIQRNYDRILPAIPRDVATPLAAWYNSKYGS